MFLSSITQHFYAMNSSEDINTFSGCNSETNSQRKMIKFRFQLPFLKRSSNRFAVFFQVQKEELLIDRNTGHVFTSHGLKFALCLDDT
jgi:hypothetical protein